MKETLTEFATTEAPPLRSEVLALLRAIPLFSGFTDEALHSIDGAEERRFAAKEEVSPQGSTERKFYILLEGLLRVFYTAPEEEVEHVMATVHPGASFGEVQLLTGFPSTSTMRAAEPSVLLCLTEDLF